MTKSTQSLCVKPIKMWRNTLVAGALCSALLAACSKEMPRPDSVTTESRHKYQPSFSLKTVALKVYEPNTMAWEDMAIGYDEANINYNKAKLYLSIGLTEVVKDPVIAEWIIENARQHEDNVFYFDELFEKFSDTKAIMEATEDPLGEMTGWTFEEVEKQMQYDGYDIKASIYLTNTAIADPTLKPIVTPGYDIMAEDERHPSDVVLGWRINEKNEVSRINLWEEVVEGVTAPIFAIDGRATNRAPLHITADATGGGRTAGKSINAKVVLTKFQICKKYESAIQGKSEYKLTGRGLYFQYPGAVMSQFHNLPSTTWPYLRDDCNATSADYQWEEFSVTRSQVDNCTPQPINRYFARVNGSFNINVIGCEYDYFKTPSPDGWGEPGPYSRKRLYYNTYENDGWSTSLKPLSPASINGQPLALKGRMGTYSEWYQYDPNNINHWLPGNTFTLNENTLSGDVVTRHAPAYKGGYTTFQKVAGCY